MYTHTTETQRRLTRGQIGELEQGKMLQVQIFWLVAFSGLHHVYIIFTRRVLNIHGISNHYFVKVAIILLLHVQQLNPTEQNAKTHIA